MPGVVSNLMAKAKFTSIVITWSPPQEPNGVIIAYEVSYRSNNQGLTITKTTSLSTIFVTPELPSTTNVSSISVRAYTIVGPGDAAMHPYVVIPQEPVLRE